MAYVLVDEMGDDGFVDGLIDCRKPLCAGPDPHDAGPLAHKRRPTPSIAISY